MRYLFIIVMIGCFFTTWNIAFSTENERVPIVTVTSKIGYSKYSGMFKVVPSTTTYGYSFDWLRNVRDIPLKPFEFSLFIRTEVITSQVIATENSLFVEGEALEYHNMPTMTPMFCARTKYSLDLCATYFIGMDFISNSDNFLYTVSVFAEIELTYILREGFIASMNARYYQNALKLQRNRYEYNSKMFTVGLGYGF